MGACASESEAASVIREAVPVNGEPLTGWLLAESISGTVSEAASEAGLHKCSP